MTEYKTQMDEFEAAIKKFGVDNSLEYFGTPEEKKKEFDFLRLEEKPKAEKGPKLKEKILNASNVQKIQWDESNLFVYFSNGGVYQYKDIPEAISIELGEAVSPGSYLHRKIKGNYRYERLH